jgi:hypothetical protein
VIPTTTTSTTPPPLCGNGILDAGEQCDTAAGSSPCVGRAPCKDGCLCPGKSCHDLPESSACNDLDQCTDDDVCHARICDGERKCKVELPEKSPIEPKHPTVPVVIEGEPKAKCKVSLFERLDAAPLASGAVEGSSDPLPEFRNGRPLGTSSVTRIKKTGRRVVKVRLNRIAKTLLEGQQTANAIAEVSIKEKGGKKRLLRQLLTLVRP